MAEYYRNPYGSSDRRDKNGSIWLVFADAVMWFVTVAAIAALVIVFAGRFISPDKMWYFSLLGLVAPVIYVAVILSMLYWIIRWKWMPVAVTAVFVLLGLFHVPLYYKLDLTKQYGEPQYDRNSIKVLTFNARFCHNDSGASTVDSVIRLVESLNPDIVCFQEYPTEQDKRQRIASRLNGYNACSHKIDGNPVSMECFSKYRIGSVREVPDLEGTGLGMSADLYINDDTVRVYNIHLQTTSVSPNDNAYIVHAEFISDSTREKRFVQIARGLRHNNALRAQQAEVIRRDIADCALPVILCGDFNDVPVSYAYRTASKGLYDTFSKQGHMYAHTYRGFFNALRIDYIFASPYFETLSYDVVSTGDISDHYPVTVRIKQTQKQ